MFKRILIIAMTVIVTIVSTGCGGSSSSSSSGSANQCAESGCTNTRKAGSSFCSAHQNIANAVKNGYFD
jgi:ABC-type phosphate/phosphonate transport system substrate-binding protein